MFFFLRVWRACLPNGMVDVQGNMLAVLTDAGNVFVGPICGRALVRDVLWPTAAWLLSL